MSDVGDVSPAKRASLVLSSRACKAVGGGGGGGGTESDNGCPWNIAEDMAAWSEAITGAVGALVEL